MSATIYLVNPAKALSPVLGPQLINVVENLNQSFAQLLLLRAAMIQERDAGNGVPADWATMASVFGFVDTTGAINTTIAQEAFTAIDTVNTTCAAALEQMCAQFKQ